MPRRCRFLSSKTCHRALVRSFHSASIFEMHLSPSHKLSEAQSPDRAATDQFSAAAYYFRPSSLRVCSSARRVIRLDHDVEKSAAGHLKNQFVAQARHSSARAG
jgi:hypothetical protein